MVNKAVLTVGDIQPVWEVFAMLLHASGASRLWLGPDEVFGSMIESVPAFRNIKLEETRLSGALISA
jgi:hypothetical protein